jgi:hypothetical protein
MPSFTRRNIVTFLLAAVPAGLIYALSSAPGLGLVDSGELTTAAMTLGIAHPTGYPLYVLIGRIWLWIIGGNPAHGMVLFSSLCGAGAAGITARLVQDRLSFVSWLSHPARTAVAVFAAWGLALTPSAWTSTSFAEVYPLTWLIAMIILWAAHRFQSSDKAGVVVWPYVICYLFGLGFGNHFTIMWFGPVVLFVALSALRMAASPAKTLGAFAALFLLGFSVNLYLPLRAALHPLLTWSDPSQSDGLIRHLTAWQYRVWMFEGGMAAFLRKLGQFVLNLPQDVGWFIPLLAVAGMIVALSRRNGFALTIFAAWAIGVAYNLNYDIPDISTYFVSLYGAFFVLALYGLTALAVPLEKRIANLTLRQAAFILAAALLPLFSGLQTGRAALKSGNTFARDYTAEIMRTLPDSALVLQANWDIQSPYIYLSNIERIRPDIAMLDVNLMQRPWYIRQEQRRHADVFRGSDAAVNAFVRAVEPFEQGRPFDGQRIESAFVAMNNSLLTQNLDRHPVYVRDIRETGHPGIAAGFPKSPGAYFIRLAAIDSNAQMLSADSIMHGLTEIGPRERYLLNSAALSLVAQGRFALAAGDAARARRAVVEARKLSPDHAEVQRLETELNRPQSTPIQP